MAVRTHLSSSEFFGTVIQLINMGGEGLEVWDDELLAEGLSEQDNVALDTPDEQNHKYRHAKESWLHAVEGKVCQPSFQPWSLTNFYEVSDEEASSWHIDQLLFIHMMNDF